MPKKTFYITTPIYYPSGKPHIGTVYTNVVCDIIARWHRLLNEDVFFTTGTDEHAQKVEKDAQENQITPLKYLDLIIPHFKEAFNRYNISYDKFVRTTDEDHKRYCQKLLSQLYKNGNIYKSKYEGWYCNGCETYYTEKDLDDGNCPQHGTKVSWFEQEAYFFKMSKYQKQVEEYIKKNNYIIPKSRQDFILSRMQEGVRDLCISRSNTTWGVELPFDKKFRAWVWFEALPNYLSSIQNKKKYWPANLHVTAHDIMWHHSVIWLSMLIAAKLKLPKKLLVHGFIKGESGLKMSKSLGNSIDPIEILETYPVDSVRYFLIKEIPLGIDGTFSMKSLNERHNNELVNDLGNLHARILSMIEKYCNGKIPKSTKNELIKKINFKKINNYMQNYDLNNVLSEIWKFIYECNKFISDNKPWEVVKTDKKRLDMMLYNLAEALRIIAILIEPFMPSTTEKINRSLGLQKSNFSKIKFGLLKQNQIQKVGYLFNRIEDGEKMQKKEIVTKPVIQFSDFEKLDLRVGKIIKAEPHPNADKLCVLQVDFGDHKRQIVAGIKQHYKIEDLINKKIVVVVNLQPTTLRGVESQGMLLAAVNNDKVILVSPEKDISQGSKVS